MTHHSKLSHERLVWIDMEMTGLDPKKERIIELAVIITDPHLNIIEEGPSLVISQSARLLGRMDDWNKQHHEKSGLLALVRQSKIKERQAEQIVLDFLKKHATKKKPMLCGNSIHHDRRFLERYMPKIHEFLHYRHIDVSSIKAVAKYWYPHQKAPKKASTHRALDDIRESIEELNYYRKKIFKSRVKA